MNLQPPKSKQPIPGNARLVFKGVIFDVYQWEQELFDGTKTTFEKLKRPDTVVVFPVLPNGKILLTKQEQPGKEPFIGATGGRAEVPALFHEVFRSYFRQPHSIKYSDSAAITYSLCMIS